MANLYNTHTHLLISRNIPGEFLPYKPVRILAGFAVSRFLARILHLLNSNSYEEIFDRYLTFLIKGQKENPEIIFDELKSIYDSGTRFFVLTVDFDFLQAGISDIDFLSQLQQIATLKKKYSENIYAFIAADPRRNDLLNLVKHYIEKENFTGIALYPAYGYYPFDERLYPIFEYAQKYNIPVITNTARRGVFYRGTISEKDLIHPKTGIRYNWVRNKYFTENYSNPDNYHWIFKDFPSLKISFGCFGGWTEWENYIYNGKNENTNNWFVKIKQLLKQYPGAYADIAFTLARPDFVPLLKELLISGELRDKILFGSDFYMVNIEGAEQWYSNNLPNMLGETYFMQIAYHNPKRFLNIK